MSSEQLQQAKTTVIEYTAAFDTAADSDMSRILGDCTTSGYLWRGVHPFNEQSAAEAVVDTFWRPLRKAFTSLQRRNDIFFAGRNVVDNEESAWVVSMGYLTGLFDRSWLGIPPTRNLTYLRYAEFHRVDGGAIGETALFCDIVGVMQQAGCYPLPPQTGAAITPPGPASHDGLLYDPQPVDQRTKTINVVNEMIADLSALNESGDDRCHPDLLRRTWHENMAWYGPAGIGSTFSIQRYQEQHQYPFRTGLKDKVFNGHIARIAEGSYAGFFGWPNLTNTPTGGFLGLPGNEIRADMRVVDIYRRDGDKLAENWVFIDLLHWLSMQGLDVLGRTKNFE